MEAFLFLNLVSPVPDFLILALSLVVIWLTYRYQLVEYAKTGKIFGYYPFSYTILFAPVYEEVLFRGIILAFLLQIIDILNAIIVSSLVFGVWHIKNLTYQPHNLTVWQTLYTGLMFGPIVTLLTIYYGNILPAILVHALNNYLSPISTKLLLRYWKKI